MEDSSNNLEWNKYGFTPIISNIWKKYNFHAKEAYEYRKYGFTPEEANEWKNYGFTAQNAKEWQDAGFTVLESKEWKKLNVPLNFVINLKNHNIDYELYKKYIEYDIAIEKIIDLIKNNIFPNEYKNWKKFFNDLNEIIIWKKLNFKPEEAYEWKKNGFSSEEAIKWKDYNFFNTTDVKKWLKYNFTPKEAYEYEKYNFTPEEANKWKKRKFKPEEVIKWKNYGFSYYDADEWKYYGFALKEASEWRCCGFLNPIDVKKWLKYKFAFKDASEWKYYGFTPEEANKWKKRKFKPEEAIKWKNYGFSYYDADEWKYYGFASKEASEWKNHDFNPQEANEWKNLGINVTIAFFSKERGISYQIFSNYLKEKIDLEKIKILIDMNISPKDVKNFKNIKKDDLKVISKILSFYPKEIKTLELDNSVCALAVTNKGLEIALGFKNKKICFRQVFKNKCSNLNNPFDIYSIVFDSNGKEIFVGSKQHIIKQPSSKYLNIESTRPITSLKYKDNLKVLIYGTYQDIYLYDCKKEIIVDIIHNISKVYITSLDINLEKNLLIFGDENGNIGLYKLDKKELFFLKNLKYKIIATYFITNNILLIIDFNSIKLLDLSLIIL